MFSNINRINKIKYRLNFLKVIKPYTMGVKRFFLFNLIISILIMILNFINPLFYKLFVDDVILGKEFNKIFIVIAGYIGIFILNTLFSYLKNYNNNRLVNRVNFKVKFKIWRGFFNEEFFAYENISTSDMKMRLDDDTACISNFANVQTIDYIFSIITLIVSLCLLFIIDWRLALFSVMLIPITFWFDHFISKREAVCNNNNRENDEAMSSWLHHSVQGFKEIKALNLQKHEELQFTKYIHKFAIYFGTWINYWVVRVLIIPKMKDEFFMQFGLYFIGGILIINGNLQIGSLLVFMQYYAMLGDAVKTVSSTDAELTSQMPYSDRMLEQLKKSNSKKKRKNIVPSGDNTILFENVSFSYPNSKNIVVDRLSFKINKGEHVAITGKSGCGKTTVLKLMLGMLTPNEGRITFSDVDLTDIYISQMHKRIGFVMQENILFNTTIKENLLYGKYNATDAELDSACQKAYILDFIKSLPNGYHTIIGEKGIKLSGGQKQRIVLARLFLCEVEIFIFDEATSALDQYSESIIHDAINEIGNDKTIIIVAHRQSSIALCNRRIEL